MIIMFNIFLQLLNVKQEEAGFVHLSI